jgi:lysophospholipid acyltransferase (LPLAT)-like uncharacterized protein
VIRSYVLGFIVWLLYKTISLTWRVTLEEPADLKQKLEKKIPVLFAHWHGDEIVLISLVSRYKIATITSTSKDGSMMDVILRLLGGSTSRGSSTRGAVMALKGLIRLVRQGRNSSFAVDGPKGPLHQVKPGIFEVSRMLSPDGGAIYAAGVSADHAWHFPKSWNKTYFPKPFARVHIQWTKFSEGMSKESDPRSQELLNGLADALRQGQAEARKKIDLS